MHGILLHGLAVQISRMSLASMGWMGTANLVGAAIYAARILERWAPVRFDMFGASHQILHVAVIVAACIHFCGVAEAFSTVHAPLNACFHKSRTDFRAGELEASKIDDVSI